MIFDLSRIIGGFTIDGDSAPRQSDGKLQLIGPGNLATVTNILDSVFLKRNHSDLCSCSDLRMKVSDMSDGRRLPLSLVLSATVVMIPTPTEADAIVLKSGQKIVGQVLKVQSDAVFVDIGIDVIRIPVDHIESREEDNPTSTEPTDVTEQDIFQTATLPRRTVKENVVHFGEGVVRIQTPTGLGSGFIIDSRGFCVTNYHVVERQTRIGVTIYHRRDNGEFERRSIRDVKILALNPFFDLALLKIPRQNDMEFQAVFVAQDNSTREGDPVFAIGNPLGLERSVSEGIVSTRNRNIKGVVYIQTTAQINPGNSGGPLFNNHGEVVGVINMKLTFGEGLGFAIPIAYLKHFLDNRDAFAFDRTNPNTGYHYLDPPRRKNPSQPPGNTTRKLNFE